MQDGAASSEPTPQAEAELSPLHLADGLLENVENCGDCGKPILQSAMAEHAASAGSSFPPKKSKLVLHLGGPAPEKEKPKAPEKKNKRIVDVDRQCGVINDKGYPCPRSLTCKTHNMSAKRAVPHRSKPYDVLLFEWTRANKANQQKAEAAKHAQPRAGGAPHAIGHAVGDAGAMAAPTLAHDASGAGLSGEVQPVPGKARRKKSGLSGAAGAGGADGAAGGPGGSFKIPGDKKGKKGIVYVGEWDESDDDGADELVDSDEEVETVLRGLGRVERGRPLFVQRGGGAGFTAASMFTGRNAKLNRLRGTMRDIFRPAA
ncbi:hypothetical protein Rhopal_004135-T1 [Rhodotorula paludigena]|uniref:SCA7 domain-containing protein n=1 Tax=Rhodotorula paludigena TaxID=86838 RepID=A0AAV5GQ29_9BASI|nr:hypothetical protein Rhopal_004135-T1 [Rhodotorula paludigena]